MSFDLASGESPGAKLERFSSRRTTCFTARWFSLRWRRTLFARSKSRAYTDHVNLDDLHAAVGAAVSRADPASVAEQATKGDSPERSKGRRESNPRNVPHVRRTCPSRPSGHRRLAVGSGGAGYRR